MFQKFWAFFLDIAQTIFLAGAIFVFIYMFLFRPFQVSGLSMFPTFHDKEYILTNLISLRMGAPKRGDVIVFRAPLDHDKDFIKRVIGVGGDKVLLRDGIVYLNDQVLDESKYLASDVQTRPQSFMRENEPVTVPTGQFLVMGDNRGNSSDSREWGFLTRNDLIGRSVFVYWPLANMRLIKNPFTN